MPMVRHLCLIPLKAGSLRDERNREAMKNTLVITEEQVQEFLKDGAMNNQYGMQAYFTIDEAKAQALLPPPLKLTNPGMGYLYIVNIREPSFGPWYMEGGIGIMAEYEGIVGLHFIGLMLSGPGALMGMCAGREGSGLPKKLCERILVERKGDFGRCLIERGGVPLIDVELKMGEYNQPIAGQLMEAQEESSREHPVVSEGGCLLFKHRLGSFGTSAFHEMELIHYDSPTRFYSWEPAKAQVTLGSTHDDPWGAIPLKEVIGAGWMVSDNWVRKQTTLHRYPDSEAGNVMRYLFSGRYDQSTLYHEHQIYQ